MAKICRKRPSVTGAGPRAGQGRAALGWGRDPSEISAPVAPKKFKIRPSLAKIFC